jgi:hypothetical protein
VTVTEVNDAPVAGTLTQSAGSISENGSVTATLSFSDVETDQTYTCKFEWGEGVAEYVSVGDAGSCSKSHQYLDDNPTATASDLYDITVTVTDSGTTNGMPAPASDSKSTSVTVNNLGPVVTEAKGPIAPVAKGAPITATAKYTDVGSQDTHTCTFAWDDGTASTVAGAAGSCQATHIYSNPGVYTINVTVTDDDTAFASRDLEALVVVYDPNGGFVTGGGHLQVAAGSYTADPTLSGRANFGFVAKYKKGATIPEGQTEFQFQVGNLNFHSETYKSLVVSSFKAQYRGTGAINGVSGYDFIVTAYDGQISGGGGTDKFRIKITKAGATVFDNRSGFTEDMDGANPQAIAGGSIVIHAK